MDLKIDPDKKYTKEELESINEQFKYLKLMEIMQELKELSDWKIAKDINDKTVLDAIGRIEHSLNKFIDEAFAQFVSKSECALLHKASEDKAAEEKANREKLENKIGQILFISVCSLVGFLTQLILLLIKIK